MTNTSAASAAGVPTFLFLSEGGTERAAGGTLGPWLDGGYAGLLAAVSGLVWWRGEVVVALVGHPLPSWLVIGISNGEE